MGVSSSVRDNVASSVARSVAGVGGGLPLSLATLRQFALNGSTPYYSPSKVGGLEVLNPLESYGTLRAPRQGRCWTFDGVDDFGSFGRVLNSVVTGSALTICGWAKTISGISTNCYMFASGNDRAGIMLARSASGNRLISFIVTSARVSIVDSGLNLVVGTSYHIAMTWDGSILRLYVNGVEVGTPQANAGTIAYDNWFVIGALNSSAPPAGTVAQAKANIWDVRAFSVAKTASEILAIKNGADDPTGLLAHYPCNEESGTVGYDIGPNAYHLALTNITEATFHATDTAITRNRNNSEGYRLSGSVYIPKRLSSSLAADGNALTQTGKSPYPIAVETPCITGDGSSAYANLGSARIPGTGDCKWSTWIQFDSSPTVFSCPVIQSNTNSWTSGTGIFSYSAVWYVFWGEYTTNRLSITPIAGWNFVECERIGSTIYIRLNGAAVGSFAATDLTSQRSTNLFRDAGGAFSTSSLADFSITTGGVTTYFPLQDGPGSSNTNRNLAWYKSDGTYGVISNAIVNGTVANIWANRVPGYVQDHCVNYGGRIGAAGEYILGVPGTSLCADGAAISLPAGKFGNPFSRLNFNPYTAAELNGLGAETAYAKGTARQSVSPTDTKFRRLGDDRLVTLSAAATGTDKTNLEAYVS